jgi:hypothetical protein
VSEFIFTLIEGGDRIDMDNDGFVVAEYNKLKLKYRIPHTSIIYLEER